MVSEGLPVSSSQLNNPSQLSYSIPITTLPILMAVSHSTMTNMSLSSYLSESSTTPLLGFSPSPSDPLLSTTNIITAPMPSHITTPSPLPASPSYPPPPPFHLYQINQHQLSSLDHTNRTVSSWPTYLWLY
ncbi:hypothetical protein LIER_36818 [Lithospermum erythrorhizon]|uniref:Uncharacterized protein n=1 Tax=Lithospermum erythrorhizon TaxID=34254 RepID=A0AAV3PD37_LITER